MDTLIALKTTLQKSRKNSPSAAAKFFKTGRGEYAEHDQFIGVPVPALRKIAKIYNALPLSSIKKLMQSPINEERLLALFILVKRYQTQPLTTYQFYLKNIKHINNWNLVDASAHLIIGAQLLNDDKSTLLNLARSKVLWERRIAIIATWYFIRHHEFNTTLKIAKILLKDEHDLIHKAVGWMLREMGKRDQSILLDFLDGNQHKMPRTMLRYAIEKLPENERLKYLSSKSN